jgi:hypothetical protein
LIIDEFHLNNNFNAGFKNYQKVNDGGETPVRNRGAGKILRRLNLRCNNYGAIG